MQILENGIQVPTNSDEYNPTADLAKMGNTTNTIIAVANVAARDALTKYVGLTISRLDARGWTQVWTGSEWYAPSPYAQASGYATIATTAAGTSNSAGITFPAGRFSLPPIMTLTTESFRLTAGTSVPTASGTTIVGYNATNLSSGQPTRVHWVATQMTPTSAAG